MTGLLRDLLVLPRTWKLLRENVDTLLEGAAIRTGAEKITTALGAVEGVASVHDQRYWRIDSRSIALAFNLKTSLRRKMTKI